MKTDRTKNVVRNVVWGTVNKIVISLGPFTTRTCLIYVLGMQYVGLSGIFSSLLSVLSLAELGFGIAMVYSMYKPIAEGNTSLICALLNLYKKVYRIVGAVILVVGLVLLPFLKYLINGEIPNDVNVYILYALYLLNSVISYFLFAYMGSLLTAHQRNDVISNISTAVNISSFAIQIAVLFMFRNYYAFFVVTIVFTVITNLVAALLARKMYPQYRCAGKVDSETGKRIKKQVSALVLSRLCGMSRNAFDGIVLSIFLGLTAVAIYSNYFLIISAVGGILAIVDTSVQASVGNSLAVESIEKNYYDFRVLNFMFVWASGFCTVCLVCLFQPFMYLWVGAKNTYPFYMAVCFALYFIGLRITNVRYIYFSSAGLWEVTKWWNLAEALANIVLNFILGYFWGAFGVIFATLLTVFVAINYGNYYTFKLLFKNGKFWNYTFESLFYLVIIGVASLATYIVADWFVVLVGVSDMKIQLCLQAVVCCVIPNLVFLLALNRTRAFRDTWRFVKGSLFKKEVLS